MSTNKKNIDGSSDSSVESAHEAIARLRSRNQRLKTIEQLQSPINSSIEYVETEKKRASKHAPSIPASERQYKISEVIRTLLMGELTQGQALKELRVSVLGVKQDTFSKMVGVSRKTISEIENDRGVFKTDILDKAFKPFGLKVGLIPVSNSLLNSVLSNHNE